jgi:hypothetical protein
MGTPLDTHDIDAPVDYKRDRWGRAIINGKPYKVRLPNHNYAFHIFNGTQEVEITTTPLIVRREEMQMLTIDGKQTSISTKLGKDWEKWWIFREIYSNMLDESATDIQVVDVVIPEDMTVSFYLEYSHFEEVYRDFDKYFSFNRTPLFSIHNYSVGMVKFYKAVANDKCYAFRKGILVSTINVENPLFDIELDNIHIDESRKADQYNVLWYGGYALSEYIGDKDTSFELLRSLIESSQSILSNSPCPVYLGELCTNKQIQFLSSPGSFKSYTGEAIYKFALEKDFYIISEREYAAVLLFDNEQTMFWDKPTYIIPDAIMAWVDDDHPGHNLRYKRGNSAYIVVKNSELLYQIENMALDMINGLKLTKFPECIQIVEFFNEKIYGMAENKTMTVSISNKIKPDQLAATVAEELLHLQDESNTDASRYFQTYLIKKCLELANL